MTKSSSIKHNLSLQMVYEIMVLIIPFITSPYISRVIGADGLGVYSYTYSIVTYFVLIANMGIRDHGNRTIARVRDNQDDLNTEFSNLYFLHLIVSVIVLVGYFGYIVLYCESYRLISIVQSFYIVGALLDISWLYFGLEDFKTTVFRSMIVRLINLISIFLFVHKPEDLWIYCLISAVSSLISSLIFWMPLKKYVRFVRPSCSCVKRHIKPIIVLFLPGIAVNLYKYMDKIMLGNMSTMTILGYYENAEKIVNMPMTLITAFGTVMLPRMSNIAGRASESEMNTVIKISMKYIMCLAMALSFGMAAVGKIFAPVFWGESFREAGDLIMLLSMTMPFIAFANIIRTQYLIPMSRDRIFVLSTILGAFINLFVNYIMIPILGAIGACMATILAEIVVCLFQSFSVRKNLEIKKYVVNCLPYFVAGIIMFIPVYLFGQIKKYSVGTLIIQIVIGVLLYSTLVFIYFIKTRDPFLINLFKDLRSRKKEN